MGVPANLKGYLYLRDAIIMALEKGPAMGSMTYVYIRQSPKRMILRLPE